MHTTSAGNVRIRVVEKSMDESHFLSHSLKIASSDLAKVSCLCVRIVFAENNFLAVLTVVIASTSISEDRRFESLQRRGIRILVSTLQCCYLRLDM
jgi:hypothetical protein